ncbi:MAG: hypothetical protein R3C53_19375 [Pirellulaceae bacterium]
MMNRVESEYRRLAATKDQSRIPKLGTTLPAMHAFWAAIPETGARYNVSVLHFTPDRIENLDGMCKGYADLETLRASMVSAGFAIPPLSASLTSSGATLRWKSVDWVPGIVAEEQP